MAALRSAWICRARGVTVAKDISVSRLVASDTWARMIRRACHVPIDGAGVGSPARQVLMPTGYLRSCGDEPMTQDPFRLQRDCRSRPPKERHIAIGQAPDRTHGFGKFPRSAAVESDDLRIPLAGLLPNLLDLGVAVRQLPLHLRQLLPSLLQLAVASRQLPSHLRQLLPSSTKLDFRRLNPCL